MFYDKCRQRQLKVNENISKVIELESKESESINFAKPYQVKEESVLNCVLDMAEKD